MPRVICPIRIAAERWQPFYRGELRSLQTTALDGRTVRIPASAMRPFIENDGISGVFIIDFDERGKLIAVTRAPTRPT